MRRSLTVTPENDKKILLTKGRFLSGDEPYDIDYTTMVNILIELGHKLMWQAWNDTTTNTTVTINKAPHPAATEDDEEGTVAAADPNTPTDPKMKKYVS